MYAIRSYYDLVNRDPAVDVAFQQLLGADQIELEILLDHVCSGRVRQRLKADGGRVDQSGDVRETHHVSTVGQRKRALVPHDRVTGDSLGATSVEVLRRGNRPGLGAAVDREGRITSYNVCYTKLLRS